jgi:hypothetical protein
VNIYTVNNLNELSARFDRITVFSTTHAEDDIIRATSEQLGFTPLNKTREEQ